MRDRVARVRERVSVARVTARGTVRRAMSEMAGPTSYHAEPMVQRAPRTMAERQFTTYRVMRSH